MAIIQIAAACFAALASALSTMALTHLNSMDRRISTIEAALLHKAIEG